MCSASSVAAEARRRKSKVNERTWAVIAASLVSVSSVCPEVTSWLKLGLGP